MGKRHKKHDNDVASDDGIPVAPVVSDSDDGSTETEADALIGENDDSDFGC